MQESTTPAEEPTALVPAEVAHRALLRAREEVHPACEMRMTSDTGMVALVLPDRLLNVPETPDLSLRLAAIAERYRLPEQAKEAGKLLAAAARNNLGGMLAARTTRRTEPGATSRLRTGRSAGTVVRPVYR